MAKRRDLKERAISAYNAFMGKDSQENNSGKPDKTYDTQETIQQKIKNNVMAEAGSPTVNTNNIHPALISSMILGDKHQVIATPAFQLDYIPRIRQLVTTNPDMSQALSDTVALVNTGIFDIRFDSSVPPEKATEMKLYIKKQSKNWGDGIAGLHGLINKMVSQLMIGGAISGEWVPNASLTAIVNHVFLDPEDVVWVREKGRYHPYQRTYHSFLDKYSTSPVDNLNKLNCNTYRYYGFNGDGDNPHGTPPYLSAMENIQIQTDMMENIRFTMDLMGLMGYLDAKLQKPDQRGDENDEDYAKRLNSLLTALKQRVIQGMKDGVNVGYIDDHEFQFQATTKGIGNMDLVWQLNELQISSGLKFDAAFLGRAYNSSETSVTILFTKMLSILASVQSLVKEHLEYGFSLALLLAGYSFKDLKIEFNKSTITDTLKYQQAEEIKIRNNQTLYGQGIISQEQYANNIGYPEPNKKKPRITIDTPQATIDKKVAKESRKADKNKSKKTSTDKKNPQGTIRKQNSSYHILFKDL